MAVFKDFVGPAYTADSLVADAQATMNLHLEAIESGDGQNTRYLRLKPGLTLAATCATSPIRGIWIGEGRMFVVAGINLIEVASNNGLTVLGSVESDGLPVQIFPNGTSIMIISNGKAWISGGSTPAQMVFSNGFSATVNVAVGVFPFGAVGTWVSGDTFDNLVANQFVTVNGNSNVVDTVFSPTSMRLYGVESNLSSVALISVASVTASAGAFLDGYFIVAKPSTKQINISKINNGYAWDPIDFAIKEGYPDNIAQILADHEELWVFGTQTTEVWRNTGAAAFPLERDPSGFIHIGCIASQTPVRLAGGIAWLAGDTRGQVTAVRAQGYVPVRVSTHAIETAWSNYSTVADAVSAVYLLEGHEHWVITFPTANATWDYDATNQSWTQRGWWNGSSNDRERWMFHGFVFGKHYVGDWSTGKLYTMSHGVYQDNAVPIHWSRTAPHLNTERNWNYYSNFKLLMQAAIGAVVTLDWADVGNDGTLAYHTALSLTCAATMRFLWRRLGKSRDAVFRASGTATAKTAIVNAYLDVEQGSA